MLLLALVLSSAHSLWAQTSQKATAHAGALPAVISFHTHVGNWIRGYSQWSTSHPELLFGPSAPQSQAAQGKGQTDDSSLHINLKWPFVSYFGTDGGLIYAGMNSDANITFVQSLPRSGQSHQAPAPFPPQPSLDAYFDIFPPLQRYKSALLTQKRPVLLTICQDTAPACKKQDEAIAAFEKRLPALHLQLIKAVVVPDNKQ